MESRQALKEKNLKAFKDGGFPLYQKLLNHRPTSTLVFEDNGELDVRYDGKSLYDGKAVEFACQQVREFNNYPTTLGMDTPQPNQFDCLVYLHPLKPEQQDKVHNEQLRSQREHLAKLKQ